MGQRFQDSLTVKGFLVREVRLNAPLGYEDGVLSLPGLKKEHREGVVATTLTRIRPSDPDRTINTIMDILPLSAKVLGALGEGITHTFLGVYVLLTGCDETGRQMHEFGASNGLLTEKMRRGRAGTPGATDLILHLDVLLQGQRPLDRALAMAAFQTCEDFIAPIRQILKQLPGERAHAVRTFHQGTRKGRPGVLLVKQVAGQGAMYDTMVLPKEPAGLFGDSIIDLKNRPQLLTPNEYRDGALRSLH
ncbi:D-proline reductase, 45 kDa subunit [Clostridiaceae bacterium JG1575]|nr:D-proline reductase, 45 kDa subunit [Clostridiaceae bacterium JG1575]